ncbi:5-deoxy-glucuronate isomerase [Propionivibrio dicarboxylicus]|uniref:5-deoxy-glucuronate isomerase n=1 Tax=Propionivibrio dicarboxylicus TaxID=83767 RepID=A0A1G8N5T3_9RHOO|nr:5-deoxy-glucuronate isomerase [Propionivibrio dicarboxylicus]SDI75528.1 5-deoxy-glucuronate isomerase [Propionivibrio dicarboxylicus]
MPKYHFKPDETLDLLKPADMGLVHTSLQRVEISSSAVVLNSGAEELCLVVIDGNLSYHCLDTAGTAELGDMLYLPINSEIRLQGGPAVLIRYGAPCQRRTSFAHIRFKDVDADDRHKTYGKTELGTRREVWNCIDEKFDSSRFLMGICYGAPGGWTAWPPHEHGEKREEVYVYFNMDDGFGLQCVYDDMRKANVALVQNGHVISIPSGYHPNVGCPKTGIRYVYCMVSTSAEDRNFMDLHTQEIYGNRLE